MKIYGWIALISLSCAVFAGCGGNGTSPEAAEANKEGDASVTSVKADGTGKSPADEAEATEVAEPQLGATASPGEVVSYFLDALQAGDTPHVAGVLTRKARVEMSKEGYEVKAVGRPDMKFEIGAIKYLGNRKDAAHVETIWTSTDKSAEEATINLIWVLRKQELGWRVAGVAFDAEDGESKEFVNFENPRETYGNQPEGVETATKKSNTNRPGTRSK